MKNINYSTLKLICEDIKKKYIGVHIANCFVINSCEMIIISSFSSLDKIYISLDHNYPYFGTINFENIFVTQNGKLNETLRSLVKGTIIKDIELANNDRIIKVSLEKCDDFYEIHKYYLYIELIPCHPNLIIADRDNTIIFANHYSDLNNKRIVIKGFEYTSPISTFNPKEETILDYKKEINERLSMSQNKANKEKYHALLTFLNRELLIKEKKINKLIIENDERKNYGVLIDYANMLLTYQNEQNSLNEYIKINEIPYNSDKTVIENSNLLFKKAKKNKKTIDENIKQINATQIELVEIKNDIDIINSNNENLIYSLCNKYPKYFKNIKPVKKVKTNAPYFVIVNGTKIGYGKNKEQNDYLTFKLAKKQDTFLHVKDDHGSHVIIFKENPTNDDLSNAAQIALFISKKDIGEVSYCIVKNIKKTSMPGLVILEKYHSITIKKIEDNIKILLAKSSRFI